ncbi:hypothetical protein ACIQCF_33390 [Streptomyces sp. NPDC088353]|uniref:hypothetical protein n=1 Tax=Streptomyces sp. NPDC088353 TaxID=3365855 RepID=UPI0038153542
MALAAHGNGAVSRRGNVVRGPPRRREMKRFRGPGQRRGILRVSRGYQVEGRDGHLRCGIDPPLPFIVCLAGSAAVVFVGSGLGKQLQDGGCGRERQQRSTCDGRDHLSDIDHHPRRSMCEYVAYAEG